MYSYIAELVNVVDGDTIDVRVDLGFYISQTMRLRLNGIDAPEVRGANKMAGLVAKEFLRQELAKARVIGIRTYKVGNFGRYLSDVYCSNRVIKEQNIFKKKYLLNQRMLDEGHAKTYSRSIS